MKIKHYTRGGMKYEYSEELWRGKRQLRIEDKPAQQISKNEYRFFENDLEKRFYLKGNYLVGIKVQYVNGPTVEIAKNSWYDWILIFSPFLSVGIGILFGAIGGGLSALLACMAAYLNAFIMRSDMNIVLKVVLCISVTGLLLLLWFAVTAGTLSSIFTAYYE